MAESGGKTCLKQGEKMWKCEGNRENETVSNDARTLRWRSSFFSSTGKSSSALSSETPNTSDAREASTSLSSQSVFLNA